MKVAHTYCRHLHPSLRAQSSKDFIVVNYARSSISSVNLHTYPDVSAHSLNRTIRLLIRSLPRPLLARDLSRKGSYLSPLFQICHCVVIRTSQYPNMALIFSGSLSAVSSLLPVTGL